MKKLIIIIALMLVVLPQNNVKSMEAETTKNRNISYDSEIALNYLQTTNFSNKIDHISTTTLDENFTNIMDLYREYFKNEKFLIEKYGEPTQTEMLDDYAIYSWWDLDSHEIELCIDGSNIDNVGILYSIMEKEVK